VSTSVPHRFQGQARRDAAAFYLSQLARGVLAGEVAIGSAEHQLILATSEFLFLKIEAKQKRHSNQIEIKLSWPRHPLLGTERVQAGDDVPRLRPAAGH
jgi:amphi-Trp domain-containing protein